jgi:hypothetical protein
MAASAPLEIGMHSVLATVPRPTGVLGHGVGQLLGQFDVPSTVSACMDGRHTTCACYIEHLPVNGYPQSRTPCSSRCGRYNP